VSAVRTAEAADVADAYVWGLPLVTMHRTCAAHGGVGRGMVRRDRLATAADRTVVAPNNDTLYASGWFDLRAGDLTVDVGAMDTPDRYWSVMLLDAYTGVHYVCRRLHGTAGTRVRVTHDPTAGAPADLPVRPPDGDADTVGRPAGVTGAPTGSPGSRPAATTLAATGRGVTATPAPRTAAASLGAGVAVTDAAQAGAADPGVGTVGGAGVAVAGAGGAQVDGAAPGAGTVGGAGVGVAGAGGAATGAAAGGVQADAAGLGAAVTGGAGGGVTGARVVAVGDAQADGADRGAGTTGAVGAGAMGAGVLAMGTPTVWVLARVLVAGPDDLPAARAALAGISVEQRFWRRAGRNDVLPAARTPDPDFLAELRAALAIDPPAPWHPAPPAGLERLLSDPPAPVDVATGIERGKVLVARSGGVDRWGNGWGTRSRGAHFGDDVAYRAAFAKVSLAGHLPAENRSYTRAFDGSAPAVLRFPAGAEPPVDGFWSLCVYGPDLFLAANPLDRYSIGDRTPGLQRDPDGGLTITIGADRPSGSAAAANWLPAPPGACFLALRAYEGRPAVVEATWFPPGLQPL